MKTLKTTLVLALMLAIVLSSYSLNPSRFVNAQGDMRSIVHISKEGTSDISVRSASVSVVAEKDVDSLMTSAIDYIIVDLELMENARVKSFVVEAYENSTRVFIKGMNLARNYVREHFGLDRRDYPIAETTKDNGSTNDKTMVDVSQFDSIGILIYKEGSASNVTKVYVESHDQVSKAIEYCLSYDYLKLANNNQISDKSILQKNLAAADYSDTWYTVDVDTATYMTDRSTITTSLKVMRNGGNPVAGKYLFHAPYKVDVDMDSPSWYVDRTTLEVKGGSQSLISAYGPLPTSGTTTTVSFSLPYSITVGFDVGTRVKINKLSGGYDSVSLKTEFDVKTVLGLNAVASNMHCEAHIESYQTLQVLAGYGQFHVTTCGYQFSNPITYYNSEWDSVSGY